MHSDERIEDLANELGIDSGTSSNSADRMRKVAESVGMNDFNSLYDVDKLEEKLKEQAREKRTSEDLKRREDLKNNTGSVKRNNGRNAYLNKLNNKNYYKNQSDELKNRLENAKKERQMNNKRNADGTFSDKTKKDIRGDKKNLANAKRDLRNSKINNMKSKAFALTHPIEAHNMGEKASKVALKVMLKVGLKVILFLGALLLGAFLILALLLLILFVPLLILDSLGLTSIFGGKIKFNINTNQSNISYSENTYLQKVNNDCKTIVVDNQVYSLEDYVKGVVSAEAYTGEGIEALKAQAIAARTFAIKRTDNCTSSIENSSVTQNFTSNFVDSAVEATEATKGLVLTYNSKLIMAQYDSFYTGGDYDCDDNGCSVTYTKLPNNETHKVTVSNDYKRYIAGGHGRGMSQVASYQLAKEGKKFDYILNYFYSPDVQISSLNGSGGYTSGLSAGANGFTRRTGVPNSNNSHDVEFYYSDNNISYKSNSDLAGQCTWYAVGRANEILDAANSDLRLERAPNAKDWYQDNIDQGANAFSYSPNVNEPKVGAIIVWSSNEFGHVAVVEAVNDDGTIDYSESNISTVKNESNPYGFRYQSGISYTGTGLGTISNIWQGYSFTGYIYVIE